MTDTDNTAADNTAAAAADQGSSWKIFIRLMGYITVQRLRLVFAIISLIFGSITTAFQPVIYGKAVDQVSVGDATKLSFYVFAMLGVALVGGLFLYIANRELAILAQRGMQLMRTELFTQMNRLSMRFYDKESSGDLDARITSDVEAVAQFFSTSIGKVVSIVMTVASMTVIMASLDLVLMLVVVISIPLTGFFLMFLGKRVRRDMATFQSSIGELNGFVEETIMSQKTVQAFGSEKEGVDRVNEMSETARTADRDAQFVSFLMPPASRFANNIDVALVALVGASRAISGAITVGSVVSFIGYARQFGSQAIQLTQVYSQVAQAIAGAERVFEIIDATPDIKDLPHAKAVSHADGHVEFDDVNFSYDGETQVLFNNDIQVKAGETIGLVGPTGAGKSTIMNLLTRFYDIDSGSIKIDNIDIRDVKISDLRERCGVVPQVPFLFNESVMYNLKYGRAGATDEECIAAAKEANAHRFIERLPDGYDTNLGGGGESLSQGQRQLLTIARAIVSNPDVLVLDEATSSVDTRTERRIQVALDRLVEGRTSFVIAHRLSTVRDADRILVIRAGRIIERGTHHELLAKRGFYYELFLEQFRPELVEALKESHLP